MLQLSEIETLVQYHLRRGDQLITTGTELAITNFVFRRFVAMLPWEDFTRIYPLPTTSTAGTKTYTWPKQPNFQEVLSIEIQDWGDQLEYKRVVPGRSIREWLLLEGAPDDLPRQYRIYRDISTENSVLELRPAPRATGLIIRVEGIIEPQPFVSSIETTQFRLQGIDDAFALALAGVFAAKIGQQERSKQLIAWAASTIQLYSDKEVSPDRIREQLNI